MKRQKCCILYNLPNENALPDELDVLDQVEYVEHHLAKIGIETYRKAITSGFMTEMEVLRDEKPDFVFNLAESVDNKGELCYFIPAILNLYSLPYSGSPPEAMFLTTNKMLTYKLLRDAGISSPPAFYPSQIRSLIHGRKYILKPVWEDGSQGITAESVFIYDQCSEKDLSRYADSHWLIQEFIDGREFNITLLAGEKGPAVMPPAEIKFVGFGEERPEIVDFKAKWEEDSFEYKNTVRQFPDLNTKLALKLRETALKCWNIFGLKGYARVDMRVDKNETPYVIEVNANPCISPDSGVVAAITEAGMSFTVMLQNIIKDLNR